eukprot:g24727.t1
MGNEECGLAMGLGMRLMVGMVLGNKGQDRFEGWAIQGRSDCSVRMFPSAVSVIDGPVMELSCFLLLLCFISLVMVAGVGDSIRM